jgi:predicted small metal-binding protein
LKIKTGLSSFASKRNKPGVENLDQGDVTKRGRNDPLKEITMLIQYTCKDMGLNCDFRIKGDTVESVTLQALEHIREQHTEDFKVFLSTVEIEAMKKSLARSTRIVAG